MKLIGTVILLAFLSHGVLADDTPTPTPTPVYPRHAARPGSPRRMEQLYRQRTVDTQSQSNATARAQAKANRLSAASAQSQAKATANAREQAQHQVDAEARRESAKAIPQATPDLMRRMGFSEQDIAAQKALEDSVKGKANPKSSPAKVNDQKPASTASAPAPGSNPH